MSYSYYYDYETVLFTKIFVGVIVFVVALVWLIGFMVNRPSSEQRQILELGKENCKVLKIQKDAIDMKIIGGDCYLKKADDSSWWKEGTYFVNR